MASVLVTGANRGLGLEFARQYAAEGWRVYAACRNPAAADQLRDLAKEAGDRLTVVGMDVTDGESIKGAARKLSDVALDVLINNAGISGAAGQVTGRVDYASWARVFDVNTMGPLRVTEAFVEARLPTIRPADQLPIEAPRLA
jgi:NAD(P)-dependent dehydrogenase (short-subunit alcohol dehydrogenase family)